MSYLNLRSKGNEFHLFPIVLLLGSSQHLMLNMTDGHKLDYDI